MTDHELDEWINAESKRLVLDIYKRLLEKEREQRDIIPDVFDRIATNVLASYIGTLVYQALSYKDKSGKMSKKDLYDLTANNFKNIKTNIQEAVASGFTGAMSTYSGKQVDYYCKLMVVPPAINKEPC